MRVLSVALALLAATAGAAAALHLPGAPAPPTSLLASGGPAPTPLPGASADLDALALGAPGAIQVVAFRADTAGTVSYSMAKDLDGTAIAWCHMEQVHTGTSADRLRALGLGLPLPPDTTGGFSGSGGAGHTPSPASASVDGLATPAVAAGSFSDDDAFSESLTMAAGDRLLLAFGHAGRGVRFSDDSVWTFHVESTGDLSMETLPSAPMACDTGFEWLDGATGAHVLGTGVQFGGSLALESPYGMAGMVLPFGTTDLGPQEARLTIGPGTWDVAGLTNFLWDATVYGNAEASLEVTRWDGGAPAWSLQGFPWGPYDRLPAST